MAAPTTTANIGSVRSHRRSDWTLGSSRSARRSIKGPEFEVGAGIRLRRGARNRLEKVGRRRVPMRHCAAFKDIVCEIDVATAVGSGKRKTLKIEGWSE